MSVVPTARFAASNFATETILAKGTKSIYDTSGNTIGIAGASSFVVNAGPNDANPVINGNVIVNGQLSVLKASPVVSTLTNLSVPNATPTSIRSIIPSGYSGLAQIVAQCISGGIFFNISTVARIDSTGSTLSVIGGAVSNVALVYNQASSAVTGVSYAAFQIPATNDDILLLWSSGSASDPGPHIYNISLYRVN